MNTETMIVDFEDAIAQEWKRLRVIYGVEDVHLNMLNRFGFAEALVAFSGPIRSKRAVCNEAQRIRRSFGEHFGVTLMERIRPAFFNNPPSLIHGIIIPYDELLVMALHSIHDPDLAYQQMYLNLRHVIGHILVHRLKFKSHKLSGYRKWLHQEQRDIDAVREKFNNLDDNQTDETAIRMGYSLPSEIAANEAVKLTIDDFIEMNRKTQPKEIEIKVI